MKQNIHNVEPNVQGRHPDYPHLVYFEAEPHYGSLLITAPLAAAEHSALWSYEEWEEAVGDKEQADLEYAYLVDDYLETLGPDY